MQLQIISQNRNRFCNNDQQSILHFSYIQLMFIANVCCSLFPFLPSDIDFHLKLSTWSEKRHFDERKNWKWFFSRTRVTLLPLNVFPSMDRAFLRTYDVSKLWRHACAYINAQTRWNTSSSSSSSSFSSLYVFMYPRKHK